MFIVARILNRATGRISYISDLPGEDGADWGYASSNHLAREMDFATAARAYSDMQEVQACFAIYQLGETRPIYHSDDFYSPARPK